MWQALYYEYGSDQNYILNFQKPKGAHKKSLLLRDIYCSHSTSGPATPFFPNISEPGSSLYPAYT